MYLYVCSVYIVTDLLKALLGNGSVNTPATYVHAKVEGLPSLGNGEVNTPSILGNGVLGAVHVIPT
jgi:hypothetical protein